MERMAMSNNMPNLYQLSGKGLHISYSTTGFDGKAHLMYQDQQHTLNFKGEEIHTVESDLGMIVSVSIRQTVDTGSTTFSILLPRVNLGNHLSVPIHTEGIRTVHKFSIIPSFNQGQLDIYTVQGLQGTASHVVF
jgi:hypothetical protein